MIEKKIEFRKVRDFGEILSVTFEFLRQNFKALLKVLVFIAGPTVVIAGIFGGFYQSNIFSFDVYQSFENIGLWFLLYVASLLISYLFIALSVYEFILIYLGKGSGDISVGEVWERMKSHLLNVTGAYIGFFIIVFIAFLLLIIPGIYLSVALNFIIIVMLYEKLGFIDSLSRSMNLVSGKWWFTFGLIIVLGLIQGFISVILQMPLSIASFVMIFSAMDGSTTGGISNIILIILSIIASFGNLFYAIVVTGTVFHYFNMVERKEATGLMDRIDSIDESAV